MCNKYGYNAPHHRLREIFGQLQLPFRWPQAAPNLEPLDEINPTDPAPVVRAFEDGVRLDQLRWGFPPPRPKAGPVINFRSEGRRFTHGRCLAPATHFFEFTGPSIRRPAGAARSRARRCSALPAWCATTASRC